jgi:hypothetical protein
VKADLGERLHRAVAAELGEARADSLHRIYGGWPDAKGGLVSHGACPGDR